MLSSTDINQLIVQKRLKIEPFDKELLNPNSYDLTLGTRLIEIVDLERKIDLCSPPEQNDVSVYLEHEIPKEGFVLEKGKLYLATSSEKIKLPNSHAAEIRNKSSVSKLFLSVVQDGGLVDAGFEGYLTFALEPKLNVLVRPKQRIAQLVFYKLITASGFGYKPSSDKACYLNPSPVVSCGCELSK
jgi:dCTP deaminase